MKGLAVICCLVVFLVAGSVVLGSLNRPKWNQLSQYTFEEYVRDFNKNYDKNEFKMRASVFYNNLAKIHAHNADTEQSWKAGVNPLTDLTDDEFRARLGYKHLFEENSPTLRSIRAEYQIPYVRSSINKDDLPKNVDWRKDGIITAVKDQGGCGSCWTFGTAETIESYYAQKYAGQLGDLSEQQILDCTPNPDDCGGTGGCGGGTPELAYAQIMKRGGIASEWQYPYTSYFGQPESCSITTKDFVAKLSGYIKLPPNQYDPIVEHIATVGPLAINVDASAWSTYESGVFNGCNQRNPDIDHVVQLVGYGTDDKSGMDYWLVRNSWSPSWGEDGYIRLFRTSKMICGIDLNPQDGTGCNGGPSNVTVCGTCGIWYDTSYPAIV